MTETQNCGLLVGPAGFWFCGVGCDEFKLDYIPDNANTYVYQPAKYELHEQQFDGHDGGYFYGTTTQPKEFKLRCIFQNEHINNGILTNIFNFYRRGRTGRLIFAKRPWVYYNATVVGVEITQLANYMGGIITINMKAYYPFGRQDFYTLPDTQSDLSSLPNYDPDDAAQLALIRRDMLDNSAMMDDMDNWHLNENLIDGSLTSSESYALYNPGTERAHVAIKIAGNMSEGVVITNRQTGQKCIIRGINTTSGTYEGYSVVIDSLSGKVLLEDSNGNIKDSNGNVRYGFLYHDGSYIELVPSFPAYRNLEVFGENNQQILTVKGAHFTDEDVGRIVSFVESGLSARLGIAIVGQMKLGNTSTGTPINAKIQAVHGPNTIEINHQLDGNVNSTADAIMYNEINVSPLGTSMSITKLMFDYKPTFN